MTGYLALSPPSRVLSSEADISLITPPPPPPVMLSSCTLFFRGDTDELTASGLRVVTPDDDDGDGDATGV